MSVDLDTAVLVVAGVIAIGFIVYACCSEDF